MNEGKIINFEPGVVVGLVSELAKKDYKHREFYWTGQVLWNLNKLEYNGCCYSEFKNRNFKLLSSPPSNYGRGLKIVLE